MCLKHWYFAFVLLIAVYATKSEAAGSSDKCPQNCNCSLAIIQCTDLHQLPDTFAKDVRTVDFTHSLLPNLTTIKDAEELLFLGLSDCGIAHIMYDAFDNLDNLNILDLSFNKISRVTDDVFEWNPLHLKELRLHHNKLDFIQHFLLYDLEELTILDLSYNSISFIHPHAFSQLKNLNVLKLSGNKLHTFDPKWMKGLKSNMFKMITVAENPWSCDCAMKPAKKWIHSNSWVHSLLEEGLVCKNASQPTTPIFKLPDTSFEVCKTPVITGISKSTQLREGQSIQLDCKLKAGIYPFPTIVWVAPNSDHYSMHTADRFDGIEAFANGSIIIHQFKADDAGQYNCTASNSKGIIVASTLITVGGEHIKNITEVKPGQGGTSTETETHEGPIQCITNCTCISRHVDCSSEGFRFTEFPDTSKLHKDILTITLANNDIPQIPNHAFKRFTKLQEIRLDNNAIGMIAKNAFEITSVSTLTMRDNRIRRIQKGLFNSLEKLTILVLDNNELTEINNDMFKKLGDLQWLYVRNNKITQISDKAFADLNSIRFIHLEGNMIQRISYATILPLIKPPTGVEVTINKIFVDENQFVCDCKMKDMRTFLVEKKKWSYLFGEGIICSYPIDYDKQSLIAITGALNCTDESLNMVVVTKPNSGSMSGLWFGGLALGIILTVATIFVWRKWRCRIGGPSVQYQNVPGVDDASEHASILSNKGGGSEAFV